ncbi:MAG: hypothetical protein IKN73_03940 [Alphaproteobacteria bacterium]|nr:hypothetical protein [Alphaproteobacteria bacterium]
MTNNELFFSFVNKFAITHDETSETDVYVVYAEKKVLFNITYLKKHKQYVFDYTPFCTQEFIKHGIYSKNLPDTATIYNIVTVQYKQKLVNELFETLVSICEINQRTSDEYETYFAENSFGIIFKLKHNKKTNQYTFKRDKILTTIYDDLQIPHNLMPQNHKELFEQMRNEYNYQVVRDTVKGIEELNYYYSR